VPNTPAPFIVVQDERWFVPRTHQAGADGKPRTDLPFMPVMLDNLISQRRIPSIVAVLLSPGPGGQRTIEYDTVSGPLCEFRGDRGAASHHARLPGRFSRPIPKGAPHSARAPVRRPR
jgi:hypothetical protein